MSGAFPPDEAQLQQVLSSRMEFFEVLRRIGKGSYGSVYLARERSNHRKQWVVKRLPIDASAKKEIDVMCKLKHRYIVKYKESFIYEDFTCIVMGWCAGGDLSNFIKEHALAGSRVDESLVLRWMAQLLEALDYLHSDRHILHRDIKTQNIFLDESKSSVKLGDFGIARCLDSTGEMASTVIGTPFYMSPELCQNKPYNTKSDIWALGCVIYELMALKHAFEAANIGRLVMRIMSADYDPLPSNYSQDLSDIIKKMLALNPEQRPSVAELLELPIIREARDALPAAGIRNSVDFASLHHFGDGTPVSHGGVSPTPASQIIVAAGSEHLLPCHDRGLMTDASLPAAGIRNSVDFASLHPVGDGTPLSHGGVSPTPASQIIVAAGSEHLLPCHNRGLTIDASMPLHSCPSARVGPESVSPITPIGSEGGSSLTSPQLPESAVKSSVAVQLPSPSESLHCQQQHLSENYVDDFEPEPDDAWEAQLPRSRTASSEVEHIQEEEGALRTDCAALPDHIEDECSDGSYEDDFDIEQDVAVPAVKLNGSICTIPLFDASSGSSGERGVWSASADAASSPFQ